MDRVQLEANAEVADRLGRLDEGAADVVTPNETELERKPCGFGVSERGRDAAIGNRDDQIGLDRLVFPQGASHAFAGVVDADSVERGIGAGKVDVLEDAHVSTLGVGAKRSKAPKARLVDHDHLPRVDVANELGTDQLKRRRLRRDDVRAVELSEAERAKSVRVPHGDELVRREKDQRVRALDLVQRVGHAVDHRFGFGACDEMNQHLRVAVRREDRTVLFELVPKCKTVGQVAVVCDGDRAMTAIDRQRLCVLDVTSAGGRVADMSDGAASRQLVDLVGGEDILHEAHPAVHEELRAVARNDARGLLASVLQ